MFTEWNPVLGEYAADGTITAMTPYLTGTYAGLEKWEYPIALQGGEYKGTLYALPMSMNSWALYYNKSMLKAAGISSPPTTLAQLYADQAKEWKISGSKLEQIGFDPDAGDNAGFEYYGSFFGAVNCFGSAGKYSFETCPGALTEANLLAQYDNYPLSDVEAMQAAYGAVAGGDDDPFVAGKMGFDMDGPWEGAQNIPVTNPSMNSNFGVVAFPGTVGQPSTFGQGNYNIIPKGAVEPAGRVHVRRVAGRIQQRDLHRADRSQGRLDARVADDRPAAGLSDLAQGQPVAERVRGPDVEPGLGGAVPHRDGIGVRDRRGDRDRRYRRAQQDTAAGAGLHRSAGQQRGGRLTMSLI